VAFKQAHYFQGKAGWAGSGLQGNPAFKGSQPQQSASEQKRPDSKGGTLHSLGDGYGKRSAVAWHDEATVQHYSCSSRTPRRSCAAAALHRTRQSSQRTSERLVASLATPLTRLAWRSSGLCTQGRLQRGTVASVDTFTEDLELWQLEKLAAAFTVGRKHLKVGRAP